MPTNPAPTWVNFPGPYTNNFFSFLPAQKSGIPVTNLTFTNSPWTATYTGDIFISWFVVTSPTVTSWTRTQLFPTVIWSVSNVITTNAFYWQATPEIFNATRGGFRFGTPQPMQIWNLVNNYPTLNGSWTIIGTKATNTIKVTSGVWSVTGWGALHKTNVVYAGNSTTTLSSTGFTNIGTNGPWTWTDPVINATWRFYDIICTQ
jgi:hypothetical protein